MVAVWCGWRLSAAQRVSDPGRHRRLCRAGQRAGPWPGPSFRRGRRPRYRRLGQAGRLGPRRYRPARRWLCRARRSWAGLAGAASAVPGSRAMVMLSAGCQPVPTYSICVRLLCIDWSTFHRCGRACGLGAMDRLDGGLPSCLGSCDRRERLDGVRSGRRRGPVRGPRADAGSGRAGGPASDG
jgi:hypothetical protein